MRIITGKYKGRHFDIPRTFKARPTTDFAKENIFNVLVQYVDFDGAEALDLFSGTGSISLELLSRGCAPVVSVEKDFKHYQYIRRICGDLKDPNWHPIMADVFKTLSPLKGRELKTFDIIFADPPYSLENLKEIPDLIFQPEQSQQPPWFQPGTSPKPGFPALRSCTRL